MPRGVCVAARLQSITRPLVRARLPAGASAELELSRQASLSRRIMPRRLPTCPRFSRIIFYTCFYCTMSLHIDYDYFCYTSC